MATYMVSYDLNAPGKDYGALYDKLKSYSKWWHYLDSTWLIVTSSTASQVRDNLKSVMDANDALLVVQTGGVGAWFGFNEKGSKWIKDNI